MSAGRPRGSKTLVTTEEVYQCIVDLCSANPPRTASRKIVAHDLGVPYPLVDEKFDRLFELGRIRRVSDGAYEPVQMSADQVVSASWIPGVAKPVKLEIGDICIDLTLRDVRSILFVLGGFGMQFDLAEFRRRTAQEKPGEMLDGPRSNS